MTDDAQILSRIEELVQEESRLYEKGEEAGLAAPERRRLREVQSALDALYDVLQRRHALWEAGLDPDQLSTSA